MPSPVPTAPQAPGPAPDVAPPPVGDPALVPLLSFLVGEVAVAACTAVGERAGAMLVGYRPWDPSRPTDCKAYFELRTVTGWLRAAELRARGEDPDRHAATASARRVCLYVAWAVAAWEDGGADALEAVPGHAAVACEAAAALSDDPAWVLRLRLVARGASPDAAARAAAAAVGAPDR